MPDAKRLNSVTAKVSELEDDPRHRLAQQYLQRAAVELAEKEAAQPRRKRTVRGDGVRPFSLSISPATFIHVLLAAIALTFASLAILWCYHLLLLNFVAGRVVAVPTGVIVAATLGYLSVLFLGFIESTSTGHTDVEALQGDWQEWFWTLPSTVGLVALTAFIGWLWSRAIPVNVWLLIGLSVLLLYPIFQLSSLESGSPFAPLSFPVLQSLARHPLAWIVLYAISHALVSLLWVIGRSAWRDPPYVTVLIMAPLVAVALFFYAWMLGQLALLISSGREAK